MKRKKEALPIAVAEQQPHYKKTWESRSEPDKEESKRKSLGGCTKEKQDKRTQILPRLTRKKLAADPFYEGR